MPCAASFCSTVPAMTFPNDCCRAQTPSTEYPSVETPYFAYRGMTCKLPARRDARTQLCNACAITVVVHELIDFDGDVAEVFHFNQARFVGFRKFRLIGDDCHNSSIMARPDLPQMQVGNAVAVDFEPFANGAGKFRIRHDVDQDRAGGSDQS